MLYLDYNHRHGLLPLSSFVVLVILKKKKSICSINKHLFFFFEVIAA